MIETQIIKLSANENCYGCSEKVYQAIENKYRQVYAYPEMNPVKLKEKIAAMHGVKVTNVVIAPGSVKLIDSLIQVYSKPDDEILTFEKSFIAYSQLTQMHGRICKFAPLSDWYCRPKNLLPYINKKTKVIFLANPNNPTGTIISHSELESLLTKVPENIIVVHDEAYAEYVYDEAFPNSFELQKKYPNLVVLHSFSKIYGLAGLRIGYALAQEHIANELSKVQLPYSLNYLTTDAALAALEDKEFIKRSALLNLNESNYLFTELQRLGFNTIPSHANFVYLWFDSDNEKEKVYTKLFNNGIVICDLKVFGQDKSLRIGIGDEATNKRIIEALSE